MPGRAYHVASARALRQRRMAVVRAKVREIFMPALSSTMMEGKVISWMAAEGDRIAKGDPVVVVKSDKADMDVETFYDGITLLTESEEEVPLAQACAQALSKAPGQEAPPPHAAAAAPPTRAPAPAPWW